MLIVFTTTADREEAERLAGQIVVKKLAACVQVMPPMVSFYHWDEGVRSDPEHLLLIKTLEEKYTDLERFITENHSYDVPEIVAVPAENVSPKYLEWMEGYLVKSE